MARTRHPQDLTESAFKATMYWRVAYGVLRIYVGYRLLGLIGLPLSDAYQRLVRHEITESDRVYYAIGHLLSQHAYSITYFMAAYLFFWGFVDIVLSLAMVRHILWTFALSFCLIGLFGLYELYRYLHTHSPLLIGLILIDLFVMYMVGLEYRKLKTRRDLEEQ